MGRQKDGTITVSYSELDTFRQCPLKHYLRYNRRWDRPQPPGSALAKGTLFHEVLERHFLTLKQVQDDNGGKLPSGHATIARWCAEAVMPLLVDDATGQPYSDVHDLILWMYQGYVKMWGLDEQWRIRAVETEFSVPLLNDRGEPSHYLLRGKIDLLVRDRQTGELWIIDHKSGKDLPTQFDLQIDDQFGLYTWAMKRLGRPVAGAIHNACRTQRNKSPMTLPSRFARTYLNRTDIELTNLALDAYYAARAAWPPVGVPPARYSAPDPRTCSWKCDYKEPHLLLRHGRAEEEVLPEYGFTRKSR